MENLNNSFPNYNHHEGIYFNIGSETYDEKINSSFFKISNLKFCDKQENKENFNSSIRKKNSLDISYSIEQTFYENSNINIDDEFQNEETCMKFFFLILLKIYCIDWCILGTQLAELHNFYNLHIYHFNS